MKNGTNLFFLAVAAGVVLWGVMEYQKQVEAQRRLRIQRRAERRLQQQAAAE